MRRLFAAFLFLTVLALSGCAFFKGGEAQEPIRTEFASEPEEEPRDAEATFRRATLYFVSDEGFIVPVTKLVPKEEGIAKACLSYLESTPVNDEAARGLGLNTVIPAGAELEISISEGNALVDVTGLTALEDAEAELNMIQAIVNTLTEFPTVDTVTITRGGAGGALENGTELPVKQGKYPLNPERGEVETGAAGELATLYFPNSSGALTVPVARYVASASVYSCVSALIKGTEEDGLLNCFPENTLLLGAAIENGVAAVDLSEDFRSTAQTEGMFTLAYRTLYLTLAERFPIEDLVIRINGVPFEPEEVSPPACVNEG
jgi:germination protein M